MEDKPVKAYKNFEEDLSWQGFQYEVGREYAAPATTVRSGRSPAHG